MTTNSSSTVAVGERMIASLQGLLSGIQLHNLTVHAQDVDSVNCSRCCFGYSDNNNNNTAVEFGKNNNTNNDITKSQTYQALHGFLQVLQKDPTKRYHVVDQDCSTQTEDAIWLSIPKWQYNICHHYYQETTASAINNKMMKKKMVVAVAVAQLQCVVTTIRSLDGAVFHQCYNASTTTSSGTWKVQQGTDPACGGTVMVTLQSLSDDDTRGSNSNNSSPEKTTTVEKTTSNNSNSYSPFGGIQAVFSDQPKHVAYSGRLLSKLSANEQQQQQPATTNKKKKNCDVILRVFRCAPRSSLQQGIAAVLQETSGHDNVFDLWIRHVEVPEHIHDIGEFIHPLVDNNNKNISLLQLLTDVTIPELSLDSNIDDNHDNPAGTTTTKSVKLPTLLQDEEEKEKEEEPSSFLQTPAAAAAAFVPNEFSNQAFLSQQQHHPSLVTPLVSMMTAAGGSELGRDNNVPTTSPTTMLVLDEVDAGEELLPSSSSPHRSSATSQAAVNDDDGKDDALGGRGRGGGDVETTTTMASTNKDPSIGSDEDNDNDSPPVTSVETKDTTTNAVGKNKQIKAPSKKSANPEKKQKQGGTKKKVPTTKDDSPPHVTEQKNPTTAAPVQQQQKENKHSSGRHVGPICKACHVHKPRSEFSAAQLKKNKDRRCKDCVESNRVVAP